MSRCVDAAALRPVDQRAVGEVAARARLAGESTVGGGGGGLGGQVLGEAVFAGLPPVVAHGEDEVRVVDGCVGDHEGRRHHGRQRVHVANADEQQDDDRYDDQRVHWHFVRTSLQNKTIVVFYFLFLSIFMTKAITINAY